MKIDSLKYNLDMTTIDHDRRIREANSLTASDMRWQLRKALEPLNLPYTVSIGPYGLLIDGEHLYNSAPWKANAPEQDLLELIHDAIGASQVPAKYFTGQVLFSPAEISA